MKTLAIALFVLACGQRTDRVMVTFSVTVLRGCTPQQIG
jgi:hypothetical protein